MPLIMTAIAPSARYHAMDALRAFALLLGVFFHAAESFCPERWSWAIVDTRAHWIAELFQHLCHSFRMQLFFVMAGFFAALLLQRRGVGRFIALRLQRVALPLLLAWILIVPVMVLLWVSGAMMSGQYPALAESLGIQVPAAAGVLPATAAYYLGGAVLSDGFTLAHLWFLNQLIWLYALFLALIVVHRGLARSGWSIGTHIDRAFADVTHRGWLLPMLAIAVTPPLAAMGGSVGTPNATLLPPLSVTWTYAVGFGFGWLLFRQRELLSLVGRCYGLLLSTAAGLTLLTYFRDYLWSLAGVDLQQFPILHEFGVFANALLMWCLVLGCIGLFQRLVQRAHTWIRYLADASYWIYLMHLPLVVGLQLWIWDWDLHGGVKYAIVMSVSLPTLLLSYHYLCRPSWVGALLNGRRAISNSALSASPTAG